MLAHAAARLHTAQRSGLRNGCCEVCCGGCGWQVAAYKVPDVKSAFLATFEEDPFTSGVFVKSALDKYRGQQWTLVDTEDEGGIPGDNVSARGFCVLRVCCVCGRRAW